MKRGIDISEHNGSVDFYALREAGIEFAIIRLGYGKRHLDEEFWHNIQGAMSAGLKIGVYYYDYGLNVDDAKAQAQYLLEVLDEGGIQPADLKMGIWYDMEDADGWKAGHGMPSRMVLTAMCSAFIVECNKAGFMCGVYASLDWLENYIATDQLADYVPYWVAQWGENCDFDRATLWQYTDSEYINGQFYDGNYQL